MFPSFNFVYIFQGIIEVLIVFAFFILCLRRVFTALDIVSNVLYSKIWNLITWFARYSMPSIICSRKCSILNLTYLQGLSFWHRLYFENGPSFFLGLFHICHFSRNGWDRAIGDIKIQSYAVSMLHFYEFVKEVH